MRIRRTTRHTHTTGCPAQPRGILPDSRDFAASLSIVVRITTDIHVRSATTNSAAPTYRFYENSSSIHKYITTIPGTYSIRCPGTDSRHLLSTDSFKTPCIDCDHTTVVSAARINSRTRSRRSDNPSDRILLATCSLNRYISGIHCEQCPFSHAYSAASHTS